MSISDYLPAVAVLVILSGAVLSGPAFGIPGDVPKQGCTADAFPGNGNASAAVTRLPASAVIEQSNYGAEIWRLHVPNAHVDVTDISGRPTVAYKINLHELTRTTGSSTILSRCHNTTEVNIPESTFEPNEITEDSYNATLTVTYRGTSNGTNVEEILATRNITVEVVE